jgi:hypothetical protein
MPPLPEYKVTSKAYLLTRRAESQARHINRNCTFFRPAHQSERPPSPINTAYYEWDVSVKASPFLQIIRMKARCSMH